MCLTLALSAAALKNLHRQNCLANFAIAESHFTGLQTLIDLRSQGVDNPTTGNLQNELVDRYVIL